MLFNFPLHLDAVIVRALVDQAAIPSMLRYRTPRPDPLPSDVFVPQSPHADGPAVDFVTMEQRVMDRVEADAPESGAQAVVNQLLAQEWERAFGLHRADTIMNELLRPMTEEPPVLTDRQRLKQDKVTKLEHVCTNRSGQVWGQDPTTRVLYHVGQTMACVKNDADDGRPYHDWEGMQHARRYA